MCVGEPMRLSAVEGIVGRTEDGTLIDVSLTPEIRPGDWVLTFLGAARERLDPDEARKILAALEGLRAVMAGGSAGDAFADLETREPTLPPHLQAALAAGAAQG
ncbi:HypC/HybG/HupF family hydrogenase formation chaperone [Rhodovulum sp. YEN HP10]|uniref:HypC/HybG/HupF family hydrogenase formation chaperone n=1 Tax=Rhodovulum sp. HP10 TaxID=3387397 RepID=UPI0039E11BCA